MPLHTRKIAWVAAGIFAVGAVTGWATPTLLRTAGASLASAAPAVTPVSAPARGPIPLGTAPNYRAIVAQNQAAVVGISVVGEVPVSNQQRGTPFGMRPGQGGRDDQDDPFYRFFRQFGFPNGPMGPNGGSVPMRGQGSGFIVSPDGIILSNAHVVDGAHEVTVKLSDRREFKAKVLGSDKQSDIAVLKIDAKDLPTVRLGNSDELNVGDYVLAIGAPFGLEETATAGIVSAKARSLPGDGYVPFIQTDAAVNPGNSGGPLFDSSGAVVGINSQIYTTSGGYQGVAFAIPINLAQSIKDQIVKTGSVSHGKLGVQVQALDQSLAASFGLDSPSGALVSKVEPDSAAAKAGLKPGDVILEYNGAPIADSAALSMRVNTTPPGDKATLKVWRNGKATNLTARIGSASEGETIQASNGGSNQPQLGLTVRPLTPDEREQAHVESGGLVVENAEGRAAAAGIQQGDVVLGVDGQAVKSVEQLRDLARSHKKSLALLIQRGDNRIFVPLALG